jgi:RNA polymerase primary sigma factor
MITISTPRAELQPRTGQAPTKQKRSDHEAETGRDFKNPSRLLTAEEERSLAARIKVGDLEAREVLIMANLRLVGYLAKGYKSSGATYDDLVQEGTRGLIRAARDYDPQVHNTRFSSYATYWIRNAIQRAVAANASLIRLPDYMFRLKNQFRQSNAQGNADPQAGETSGTKISTNRYKCLLHAMMERAPYSMIGVDGEVSSLEDAIADPHRPDREAERQEAIDELHAALQRLTPLEAWVVRWRFGLGDPSVPLQPADPATSIEPRKWRQLGSYREVARTFRISALHARKIEEIALQKLRSHLEPRLAPDGVLDI